MSGRITLLIMSFLLAVCSFCVGILPLSFVFAKSHLSKLSALGAGILLGTALGVIIPEGVEILVSSSPPTSPPTSQIAYSLLIGFIFMLLVEQFVSPHSHSHAPVLPYDPRESIAATSRSSDMSFDADIDLDILERDLSYSASGRRGTTNSPEVHALPMTVGLVVHGLADGMALGVSSIDNGQPSHNLSIVVFLALLVHKGPTALALTTSLLSTSLSHSACRKHLMAFAASTPIGAVLAYEFFSFFGPEGRSSWSGIALLASGGTFLYVATVLQPTLHSHSPAEDGGGLVSKVTKVGLIASGMLGLLMLHRLLAGLEHAHGADLSTAVR